MRLKLFLAAILLLGSCHRCTVKKDQPAIEQSWAKTLAIAQSLPKSGKLVQKPSGYAYLKLDDRYIHELFPRLNAEPEYKKPPYFRRKDSPGAHISVIYENEKVSLSETGQTFNFELKDIRVVRTNKASFIILTVFAPELERLRQSYGLKPRLNDQEFHITIAKKSVNNE